MVSARKRTLILTTHRLEVLEGPTDAGCVWKLRGWDRCREFIGWRPGIRGGAQAWGDALPITAGAGTFDREAHCPCANLRRRASHR